MNKESVPIPQKTPEQDINLINEKVMLPLQKMLEIHKKDYPKEKVPQSQNLSDTYFNQINQDLLTIIIKEKSQHSEEVAYLLRDILIAPRHSSFNNEAITSIVDDNLKDLLEACVQRERNDEGKALVKIRYINDYLYGTQAVFLVLKKKKR